MEIDGFILTGGESRRMGFRKDLITLGGSTLVERAAAAVGSVCSRKIRVVGCGLPNNIPLDSIPDKSWMIDGAEAAGPLRGLRTALLSSSSPWVAVLACDLPFVTSAVFERLRERLAASQRSAYRPQAVVPVQGDRLPQPLCALYDRDAAERAILEAAEAGDRSMRSLLSKLVVDLVPFSAFEDLPDAEHLFLNVNSPDDYEQAQDISRQRLGPAAPTSGY